MISTGKLLTVFEKPEKDRKAMQEDRKAMKTVKEDGNTMKAMKDPISSEP